MIRVVQAVFLMVVLFGCTLGPDYERPVMSEPASHRSQAATVKDDQSLANLQWWELFKDEQLQTLIKTAIEENNDLRLAVARVDEARAQLGLSRSELFPQVNAEGSASRGKTAGVTGNTLSTQVALSYEVDIWGRLRRGTEAARAELLASEEARLAVVVGLVSNVAQAYFELRDLDLEVEIAKQTLQSREESFKLVNLRHEGGVSSELDLRKSEVEMTNTAAVIPDLERQIVQKENALSILLGRNPGAITRGKSLSDQTIPPNVPAGLPSDLLEQRPDIRQAEQGLIAANAKIGQAKAEFFPRITLTGNLGQQSSELNDLFVGPARTWGFGPAVSLPIFDAGKRQSNLEAAEARRQQALIQYEQAIQQAFREVDDALIAHHKAREVRVQQERRLVAAKEALRLAQLRYDQGYSDYLDVLDAQRQLFTGEIELVQTQRTQLVAVVQLYKALGGGWDSETRSEAN